MHVLNKGTTLVIASHLSGNSMAARSDVRPVDVRCTVTTTKCRQSTQAQTACHPQTCRSSACSSPNPASSQLGAWNTSKLQMLAHMDPNVHDVGKKAPTCSNCQSRTVPIGVASRLPTCRQQAKLDGRRRCIYAANYKALAF